MELALYCPDCGYYEKEEDIIGKHGDFYTSVSVGSLFGELLAFQFAAWLESELGGEGPPARVIFAEAGAHDGRLAGDVLSWMRDWRREIYDRLEYVIVEPSPRRREWQQHNLADFRGVVRWVPEISVLKTDLYSSPAIIFSNELLDAIPVRRVAWDAKARQWFEWGVALQADRFVWSRMNDIEADVLRFAFQGIDLGKLQEILPDGFTTELNPAAETLWREAAATLKTGKLLTIDYGLSAEEFFIPERKEGTLRAYHDHHLTSDLLAIPGQQDITAHVNFSAIQNAGARAGLRTEELISQAEFLTKILASTSRQAGRFGDWNPSRTRQFQTLTHPEHLGRPFRVLVQSR